MATIFPRWATLRYVMPVTSVPEPHPLGDRREVRQRRVALEHVVPRRAEQSGSGGSGPSPRASRSRPASAATAMAAQARSQLGRAARPGERRDLQPEPQADGPLALRRAPGQPTRRPPAAPPAPARARSTASKPSPASPSRPRPTPAAARSSTWPGTGAPRRRLRARHLGRRRVEARRPRRPGRGGGPGPVAAPGGARVETQGVDHRGEAAARAAARATRSSTANASALAARSCSPSPTTARSASLDSDLVGREVLGRPGGLAGRRRPDEHDQAGRREQPGRAGRSRPEARRIRRSRRACDRGVGSERRGGIRHEGARRSGEVPGPQPLLRPGARAVRRRRLRQRPRGRRRRGRRPGSRTRRGWPWPTAPSTRSRSRRELAMTEHAPARHRLGDRLRPHRPGLGRTTRSRSGTTSADRCPVAHSDRYGGVWLPTRHDDVAAIAYDTEHFSSRGRDRERGQARGAGPDRATPRPSPPTRRSTPSPAACCSRPFSPKAIDRARAEHPRARAASLLDGIGDGPTAATPPSTTPSTSRCGHRQHARLPARGRRAVPALRPPRPRERAARRRRTAVDLRDTLDAYLDAQIADHRANPRDDLIDLPDRRRASTASHSTHEHIRGTIVLLLIAGIDTTWTAIGASLWHLAQHPERPRPPAWPSPSCCPSPWRSSCASTRRSPWPASWPRTSSCGGAAAERRRLGAAAVPGGQPRPREFERRRRGRHRPRREPPRRVRPRHPPLPRVEPGPHGAPVALEKWLARIPDFELRRPVGRHLGRRARCADRARFRCGSSRCGADATGGIPLRGAARPYVVDVPSHPRGPP